MRKIKGQSTLETAVLIVVIIMALVAMQVYLKRGMQGRMRSNIDSIGEQYDPEKTQSDLTLTHTATSRTNSTGVISGGGSSGYETTSTSNVDSFDHVSKRGTERISR